MTWCWRRSSRASAIVFIILAGSCPLALSGALLFVLVDDAEHLQPGRIDYACRAGSEERHPDRRSPESPQETGCNKLAAVIEASGTRSTLILMTTAATVVGHTPLILATVSGAGARNSIGIMLVSGMIIGTLFTLFVVPSIYVLVAWLHATVPVEEEERTAGGGCASLLRAGWQLETI